VSYIDKNSSVVISARLTDKGRQLLSKGLLTFDTFRLGDSEIDYSTLGSSYDISLNIDLRAKSNNPDLKTPLFPTATSTFPDVGIPTLQDNIIETIVDSPELGFFVTGTTGTSVSYTAQTSTDYLYQADTIIPLSGLTGYTNVIPVLQSSNYGPNTYEPKIGDYMLVKMSNDELNVVLSEDIVETNLPVPYLWFKIQDIFGSLSANTLYVELDRTFPYFDSYSGSNFSRAYIFPGDENSFSDNGFYSGGTVWNMNNVWSYNQEGVILSSYEGFESYGSEDFIGSKEYYGYTTEIQNSTGSTFCDWVNSIGIIHYTNPQTCENQTEKKFGQKLYIDEDLNEYPSIVMPTLMWHRELSGNSIGHVFTASGDSKFVTLGGEETEIMYYSMADEFGNLVGRLFPDLHTFTIDDQELVAAMSYKSNRNWTLPRINVELESNLDGVIDGTQSMHVTYLLTSSSGYTTGLHSKYIVCANFETLGGDCPPTENKALRLSFPSGQLPFMEISGGTGWYADRLYAVLQRTSIDTIPTPGDWVLLDLTSNITNHNVGDRIDKINLENSSFVITNTLYNTSGTTYDLHGYINIPLTTEPNLLQFGDEKFFYGNVLTKGVTTKYRTKFNFTISPTEFNTSINPTFNGSGQNVHISEVGVYSGNDLVAIGKMNLPIEKTPNSTVIIEMAFDL
jgi:signal peptidase I